MIETSFFSSKAPKGRKVCIAKWHRGWTGPRAQLFAPSDPKAADWQWAYRRDLEYRFPSVSTLQDYLREIERQTRFCAVLRQTLGNVTAGCWRHSSKKSSTKTCRSGQAHRPLCRAACCK